MTFGLAPRKWRGGGLLGEEKLNLNLCTWEKYTISRPFIAIVDATQDVVAGC